MINKTWQILSIMGSALDKLIFTCKSIGIWLLKTHLRNIHTNIHCLRVFMRSIILFSITERYMTFSVDHVSFQFLLLTRFDWFRLLGDLPLKFKSIWIGLFETHLKNTQCLVKPIMFIKSLIEYIPSLTDCNLSKVQKLTC